MTVLAAFRQGRLWSHRGNAEHGFTGPVVVAVGWRTGLVVIVAGVGCLIWRAALASPAGSPAVVAGDSRGLAATFLTTVIAIYAVFLSVYGTLIGPLLDRRPDSDSPPSRRAAWWTTIILVGLAILIGLWRVWNAVGDLYILTAGAGLGDGQHGTLDAHDALEDFRWIWAPVNIAVILVAMRTFLEGRATNTSRDAARRSTD